MRTDPHASVLTGVGMTESCFFDRLKKSHPRGWDFFFFRGLRSRAPPLRMEMKKNQSFSRIWNWSIVVC